MPRRYVESRLDAAERSGSLVRVNATPTAVGVFEYRRPDGTSVRELRAPEEVFHADSLASLDDVPITLGHVPLGRSHETFAKSAVGHVRSGSTRADEAAGVVRSTLVLARADAQEGALKGTLAELSGGYNCTIIVEPGVWNGQPYDQRQTKIRYDHVAVLPPGKGRMGAKCALRLDASGEEIPEDTTEDTMKITIAGKTYEGEAAQAAVIALEARADAADAQVRTLTATVARYDADAAVATRRGLEQSARGVLGAGFAFTKKNSAGVDEPLTDREIRVAVVQRSDSSFTGAGKDDVYVQARYDHALATSTGAQAVIGALNTPAPGTPGATPTAPAPRADAADQDSPAALRAKHKAKAKANGVALA